MPADHPLTLTVEQVAVALGVARSTAYELVRSGDVECLRLRRRIVVPTGRLAERLGVSASEVWAAIESASQPARPSERPPRTRRATTNEAKPRQSLF